MRRALIPAVLAALLLAPVAGAWTWPAGGAVLQPFVFDPNHPYASGQHRGIDVGGDPGATVVAPAAGTVTFAGSVPSSGKSVTIETADGYSVTLTHLGSITVAKDAAVAEGDPVGAIGPSGDPEAGQPYVHVGVRLTAQAQGYVDPLSLLPVRAAAPAAPVAPADPPPAPAPAAVEAAPAPAPEPAPAPAPVATDPAPADPAPAATTPAVAPVADAAPDPVIATAAPVAASRAVAAADSRPSAIAKAARPATVRVPIPIDRAVRQPLRLAFHAAHVARRPHVRLADPAPRAADVRRPPRPGGRSAHPRAADPVATPAHGRGLLTPGAIGLVVALLLALGAAGVAAARRKAGAPRKAAPIIDLDALLRHDTDLLRERQAPHRACVHDDRRRHPRAAPSPARRGDVLPHRRRRARNQSLAGR